MSRNLFTNVPIEYYIPKSAQVIFVSDFFVEDVSGGAEITSEALIQQCPLKIFKLHSASLTRKMVDNNINKIWIFGNFTQLKSTMVEYIASKGNQINYSIIEYDFKFCMYRSIQRHLHSTGKPCNCSSVEHGLSIESFFLNARHVFWMSIEQLTKWWGFLPSLRDKANHTILSSVFSPVILDYIKNLRENRSKVERNPDNVWAVLGSGSWIKGVEETQKWCKLNRKLCEPIGELPYPKFLEKLSSYSGFIFRPLDWDTCPRVAIEAKLLGLNLILNDNVLHKEEPWFKQFTIDECDKYLRNSPTVFWDKITKMSI